MPPAKVEPTAIMDPLGRETPLRAMMGFLKCSERRDFETAARYLQATPGQDTNLVERVKELHALHSRYKGNIGLLSDDPGGTVTAGLPLGQVRAGVLAVGGATTDIILVRVNDPASGKIWLLSRETVAEIPGLYAEMKSEEQTAGKRIVPAALTSRALLGISLAQWLARLLSIPISWWLARLLELQVSAPRRIWCKLHKLPFRSIWASPVGMPLRCIVAILVHSFFIYLLAPPLLYRVYYFRFMEALLAGCFVWFMSRLADRGFDHVVNRARRQSVGGESILILMQRLTHVALFSSTVDFENSSLRVL